MSEMDKNDTSTEAAPSLVSLRNKLVQARKCFTEGEQLLSEANAIACKLFLEQEGYDAPGGYKIPPLEKTDKVNPRTPPECCGG
jgi:hypothetical protein